jgi:hypothetical protein
MIKQTRLCGIWISWWTKKEKPRSVDKGAFHGTPPDNRQGCPAKLRATDTRELASARGKSLFRGERAFSLPGLSDRKKPRTRGRAGASGSLWGEPL